MGVRCVESLPIARIISNVLQFHYFNRGVSKVDVDRQTELIFVGVKTHQSQLTDVTVLPLSPPHTGM